MTSPALPPTVDVLRAFGCDGEVVPLSGGEGRCFRVGGHVLKPVSEIALHEWSSRIVNDVDTAGFRVSKPVLSQDGAYVHEGWSASIFEEGHHQDGCWSEKLAIGRAFHQSLNRISRPAIPTSDNRWTRAHRMVWGKENLPNHLHPKIEKHARDLLGQLEDIEHTNRLIHGDLCGNILFAPNRPPLVIDFSPAVAPTEYAEAILVADAIAWEEAPLTLLELFPNTKFHRQMMLRAIGFRVLVAALFLPEVPSEYMREYAAFKPIIHALDGTIG